MCGIVGLLCLDGSLSPETLSRLAVAMRDTMVHRGPDGAGVWVSPDGRLALAHRRLSIQDLSQAGHQPMQSPAGSAIAFNGEIYNFLELRRDLEARGHVFASHCDTEVLLAGLDAEGPSFLDKVDGMYAFVYWQAAGRRVFVGRDRFGEKPLYVYRSGPLVALASEMHAFEVLPGFDDRVAIETIASYLCFQYVPAPAALWQAAGKVLPGRCLELDATGAAVEHWSWSYRTSGLATAGRRLEDLADELEDILVETIRTRLISDVPLGAFLSGGVDSSTVVALITKRLNRSIKTFSIGFDGSDDSEHLFARDMARHLGTEHKDEIVAPVSIGDSVRFIGRILDEPNGDSSCMPTHLLAGLARREVVVALSGDGGDEMFGGYGRYFSTLAERDRQRAGEESLRNWAPGRAYYSSRLLVHTERDLAVIFGGTPPVLADRLQSLRAGLDADTRPLMNILREADGRDYLPGAVLPKVDRMSMQHSLEVRAPLLGNAVADFAARLAEDECRDGAEAGKKVLKAVAKRYLPAEWIDRRKMGFGLPMRSWAEHTALDAARELLSPGGNRLAEWVGQDALDRVLATQEKAPMLYQLWGLLVLESWLRTHKARPA